MQCPDMERSAPERHAVADDPPAQFVEQLDGAVDAGAFAQDPATDPPARYRRAQAGMDAFRPKEFLARQCRVGWDTGRRDRTRSRNTNHRSAKSVRYAR